MWRSGPQVSPTKRAENIILLLALGKRNARVTSETRLPFCKGSFGPGPSRSHVNSAVKLGCSVTSGTEIAWMPTPVLGIEGSVSSY